MAKGLHCYDLSVIMHACIKCIYRICIYLMLIRSKECDKYWPTLISIHIVIITNRSCCIKMSRIVISFLIQDRVHKLTFWFFKCFQKPQFTFNVTQHNCVKYLKIIGFKLYVAYLCNLFAIFSKYHFLCRSPEDVRKDALVGVSKPFPLHYSVFPLLSYKAF